MQSFIRSVWTWLAWPDTETDEQFRDEIYLRSWNGLRLIGWALVTVPIGMLFAVRLLVPEVQQSGYVYALMLLIATTGALALTVRNAPRLYPHSRLLGGVVVVVVSCCVTWSGLLRAVAQPELIYLINAQLAVVLLIAVIALPFKPFQIIGVGAVVELLCVCSQRIAIARGMLPQDYSLNLNILFLSMLTLLAGFIAANQYRQIHAAHTTHQSELHAQQEMRDTQCQILLSDNAASMARLAAALSHELNNPLGVLRSNLDLLRKLAAEGGSVSAEKQAALLEMKIDLYRDAERSVARLQETVQRMQRFTNLDRAEVMPVDLCSLVADVADIVREGSETAAQFELECADLPAVNVRPQLISAVFSALLNNAAQSAATGASVSVRLSLGKDCVMVRIDDHGPGMTSDELSQALEPTFGVKENRVAACNWSFFGARQAVRRQGGEIDVHSSPGAGTIVTVRLPLTGAQVVEPTGEAGAM